MERNWCVSTLVLFLKKKEWKNLNKLISACNCDYFYSTGNCAQGLGQCECKKEFQPPLCDSCSFGHYGYPKCRECDCYLNGTYNFQCEPTEGQCPCLFNFGGTTCRECASTFYNFPVCERKCLLDCKVIVESYMFLFTACQCNDLGSVSGACDQASGNCTCKGNFGGKHCDQCQDGYYDYPSCSCTLYSLTKPFFAGVYVNLSVSDNNASCSIQQLEATWRWSF